MDPGLEQVVRCIHGSATKAAVYVTGGASQGVSWLMCVPGASATVLEVVVPYSRGSLVQLLGQEPEQYCSADTALSLAKAAYQRAAALTAFGTHVVGLATTCALASEPPKRGQHRAYVAAHSGSGSRLLAVVLAKGARSRWQEEQLVGQALLQVLAQACGLDPAKLPRLPLLGTQAAAPAGPDADAADAAAAAANLQLDSGVNSNSIQPQQHVVHDEVQSEFLPAPDPLQQLLAGRVRCVEYSGGRVFVDAPRCGAGMPRVYLPGSFNPLHDGHKAMLAAAVEMAGPGAEGCFELTVQNADKGQLGLEEVQARVAQFVAAGLPLLVTRATLLVDKARLLPGATFVLGWDTAVRIVMPKYYGGSETGMALVFRDIQHAGCSFLVAGRVDDKGDGQFKGLQDIALPAEVAGLFAGIPEDKFRSDISSTALRAAGQGL
ncbi:hypothetical protein OEZ86_014725 [Tetradesmus obliquus]|nr:hypothetical protein OEZ86_014725 [Tetradesmus obliquus]